MLLAHAQLPRTLLQIVRFTAQREMCAKIPVGKTARSPADVLRANAAVLLIIHMVTVSIHRPQT